MTKEEILSECKSNRNYYKENVFKKRFPAEYESLENTSFPADFTFSQKLYHYLNNDIELNLGRCQVCGNRSSFLSFGKGYRKYCCNKCVVNSKEVQEKAKKTCLKHYGVNHPAQSPIIHDKMKQTCLEKYGVENTYQSELIKEKIKQSNFKKYGVENPAQSESIQNKIQQTNLDRYGCKTPLQNKKIKQKMVKTNLEKYGAENVSQNKEICEKRKQTCLKKFGAGSAFKSKDIQEKIKQTNLKKYGAENVFASKEIKEKIENTNLKKYGNKHPQKLDEFKNKVSETCFQKYGIGWPCMLPQARTYSNDSKPNLAFAKLLEENGISFEREFPLGRYVYDFKIGAILVEINPTATHNAHMNIFGRDPLDESYHMRKTIIAKENGYECLHVWDWNDTDRIIKFLTGDTKLYNFPDGSGTVYCDNSKPILFDFETGGYARAGTIKPSLHWYNMKTGAHIVSDDLAYDEMISDGYLPVYDCGQTVYVKTE